MMDKFADVVRRVASEQEKLTEEQFIEAMRQAVACGDFERLCLQPSWDGENFIHKQAVTYMPYRKVQELQSRIEELESRLSVD